MIFRGFQTGCEASLKVVLILSAFAHTWARKLVAWPTEELDCHDIYYKPAVSGRTGFVDCESSFQQFSEYLTHKYSENCISLGG